MHDSAVVKCPKCGCEIPLNETLAGPFIQQVRDQLTSQIESERQKALAAESTLAKERAALEIAKAGIDAEVAKGIAAKRLDLESELREQIVQETSADLRAQEERVKSLTEKLSEARASQLEALKAKEEAEEKARTIDLEVLKQVSAKTGELRDQFLKEADEASRLKLAEREKVINDLKTQLDDMKRKAEQGSQQLQGEVLELDIEALLRHAFPQDDIEEIKKGQRGGDCVQRVTARMGAVSGGILWEAKRAQTWDGNWATKAKTDASSAKAEIAVIVSDVLPKGIESFDQFDGVWVTKPIYLIPVARLLRQGIEEAATARKVAEGRHSNAERMYDYLTGPEFVARLQGIAEPFMQMQKD